MDELISVIVPTYNNAELVSRAVQSALDQTYANIEVIVVDDGSSDDTRERIQSISDNRVKYIRQDNAGPSVTRNRGILESCGTYIAFLDSDDLWMPGKLEQQYNALRSHTSRDCLVYTDYYSGQSSSEPVKSVLAEYSKKSSGQVIGNLLAQNFINTSTVFLRKDILARTGLFDPTICGAEDYHLWLRIAVEHDFLYVDEILAFRRFHPQNNSRWTQSYEGRPEMWLMLKNDKRFANYTKEIRREYLRRRASLADHYYYDRHEYLKAARLYLEQAVNGKQPGYLAVKVLYCFWRHITAAGRSKHAS